MIGFNKKIAFKVKTVIEFQIETIGMQDVRIETKSVGRIYDVIERKRELLIEVPNSFGHKNFLNYEEYKNFFVKMEDENSMKIMNAFETLEFLQRPGSVALSENKDYFMVQRGRLMTSKERAESSFEEAKIPINEFLSLNYEV